MRNVRNDIQEILDGVKRGLLPVEDAEESVMLALRDYIGDDENMQQDFPKTWGENLKQTWVKSRNHLKRQLRGGLK